MIENKCKEKYNSIYNKPSVIDIEQYSVCNENFRKGIWTGNDLQITVMSIDRNADIGVEVHENNDQIIRVEEGFGMVVFGESEHCMTERKYITKNEIFCVPAGTWHNIINQSAKTLKLSSIYGPPHHKYDVVEKEKK